MGSGDSGDSGEVVDECVLREGMPAGDIRAQPNFL